MTTDGPDDPWADGRLWHDWTTVWSSELAAMGTDRELQELMHRLRQRPLGPTAMAGDDGSRGRPDDGRSAGQQRPEPGAGTDAPARSPPGDPASDAGGAGADWLHDRIAELERRLARLERGAA